jgi:hypothetical protein
MNIISLQRSSYVSIQKAVLNENYSDSHVIIPTIEQYSRIQL